MRGGEGGKEVFGGKACRNANFSTINLLRTVVGRNLYLHGERPTTYGMKHGTVSWNVRRCGFVDIYQTFGGICCCYYHGTM